MCGIVGYLDRSGRAEAPVGRTLLDMLEPLGCRGPDSTGIAVFGRPGDSWIVRVKLGEKGDLAAVAERVVRAAERVAPVLAHTVTGVSLRLQVDGRADPQRLEAAIEAVGPADRGFEAVEVVSLGRRLEIVKQIGSPAELDAAYHVSGFRGSHGIGHTRLSTESRVDLSHSQPFWAHGMPDLAVVHNGHITNYHRLRRTYEQRGVGFYTENDSEVIGVYLRDRLARGDSLEEALRASMVDLDGSFCYLAATADSLAFAKDPFGMKPLVVAETPDWIAVATEEIALRHALPGGYRSREPAPRELRVWSVDSSVLTPA